MTDVDTTPDTFDPAELLDWRKGQVLPRRQQCCSCGGLTLLRHLDTGRAMHKVCAEREDLAARRAAQRAYDQA